MWFKEKLAKTETIGWTLEPSSATVIWGEPQKIEISKEDLTSYNMCPAHINHNSKHYQILSPYDVELTFDKDKKFFNHKKANIPEDKIFSDFHGNGVFKVMPDEGWLWDKPIFQINTPYIFFSDNKNAMIEIMAPIKHYHNYPGIVMNGSYNIYNWIRPLNFGLHWVDTEKPFVLKKGEPLFTIRVSGVHNYKLQYQKWDSDLQTMKNEIHRVTSQVKNSFSFAKNLFHRRPKYLIKRS